MISLTINLNREEKLKTSFARIVSNCTPERQTELNARNLFFSDKENVWEIYKKNDPIFQKGYSLGFGCRKGNIIYNQQNVDLIVLNFDLCEQIDLTQDEFDGVLSHELGHIFNQYTQKPLPSIVEAYQNGDLGVLADRNQIDKENRLNNEIFADNFSIETKTIAGLLGSLRKYSQQFPNVNDSFFQARIDNLEKLLKSVYY